MGIKLRDVVNLDDPQSALNLKFKAGKNVYKIIEVPTKTQGDFVIKHILPQDEKQNLISKLIWKDQVRFTKESFEYIMDLEIYQEES